MQQIYDKESLHLTQSLESTLTEAQQQQIMMDFERGRAQLLAHLSLKLAHCRQPPFLLCGLAHPCQMQASEALRQCLLASSADGDVHPQLQRLTSEELRGDIGSFMDSQLGDLGSHKVPLASESMICACVSRFSKSNGFP